MKMNILLLALTAILAAGCAKEPTDSGTASGSPAEENHSDHDGHDHGAEHAAPHGGHLIELGRNHEFHAELLDDQEDGKLIVYILDGEMKELPIDAESITLVVTVAGESQSYELARQGDSPASMFAIADADVSKSIDAEEAQGKLRVTIDGKPYSGAFSHHAHDHDH